MSSTSSATAKRKWLSTKSLVYSFKYEWKVTDVKEFLQSTSSNVKSSPQFEAGGYQWTLNLMIDERESGLCDDVHLTLKSTTMYNRGCRISSSAWVVDREGQRTNHFIDKCQLRFVANNGECRLRKFLRRDQLLSQDNQLIDNDTLTIVCNVKFLAEDCLYIGDHWVQPMPVVKRCSLRDDMSQLLTDGRLSDLELVVGEQKFKVHKAVLAARSSVFAAMFDSDMTEKRKNVVKIDDFNQEVVADLLEYIYTGISSNVDTLTAELLKVAEKYNVEGLKSMCEAVLASQLTTDNAVEILTLADTYNGLQLKKSILHWISRRTSTIIETDEWREMAKNHPQLVDEVLETTALFVKQLTTEPGAKAGVTKRMKFDWNLN